jgi:hypothetical protein
MKRLGWLFTAGLTLASVGCSGGSSQSVTTPTTAIAGARVGNPPPPATQTPITGIVLTPPNELRAGVPALFTFTVTGIPLINLTLAWGDETMTDVGAVTQGVLSHIYASAGAYTLTVTATVASGGTEVARSGPLIVK